MSRALRKGQLLGVFESIVRSPYFGNYHLSPTDGFTLLSSNARLRWGQDLLCESSQLSDVKPVLLNALSVVKPAKLDLIVLNLCLPAQEKSKRGLQRGELDFEMSLETVGRESGGNHYVEVLTSALRARTVRDEMQRTRLISIYDAWHKELRAQFNATVLDDAVRLVNTCAVDYEFDPIRADIRSL